MSQASSAGRRIAFFGGSFDPPHLGHLAVARAAREALGLTNVLFAPVGAQPLKPVGSTASFADRVAMTRLAIEGERGFEVSLTDAPKPSGKPNYTLDTLENLRSELEPNCTLYFLMGADSLAGLKFWHRAAEIPFAAPLIVASRPGEGLDNLKALLPLGLILEPANCVDLPESDIEVRCFSLLNEDGKRTGQPTPFYLLPTLDVGISASNIRDVSRAGNLALSEASNKSADQMLPAAVSAYVKAHGLYC